MPKREGRFRDVSNALVADQQTRQRREGLEQQTTAAAVRLAMLRDHGGHASYREVLTSDATPYAAPIAWAPAQHQEALSLVHLYGT
jgi:outer membrane protein, multidrug efflux system